jgi:hypothetical protein
VEFGTMRSISSSLHAMIMTYLKVVARKGRDLTAR